MVWALLILSILAFAVLAMRRAPLWQWAVAALVIGALSRISTDNGLWLMTDVLGWVLALLPAAILALNHAVNARFGWVSGFLSGAEREATIVGLLAEQLPERAAPVASYFWHEIVLDRAHSGGLLLLLLALAACFPRTLARSPVLLPALVVLGVYAGLMLVFVGAPHDLGWHLTTAARRVGFQPLPLATLVVGALAGRTLPGLAPESGPELAS